ncbi:MAG TPA: hypothetical protein VF615_21900 [Longimicrobiaceae bacterium]|jgi:hypothetical protein
MTREPLTLSLTPRQAEALRALAALEELPPEIYAAEVLVKHLYHAYTPEVARRAAQAPDASTTPGDGAGAH